MRPDVTVGQLALLATGRHQDHWLLQVANGSGTLIDLSARIVTGQWKQPSPKNPIGTVSVTLVREFRNPLASLAPLVGASLLNRLDDDVTYAALLQGGHRVVLSVAVTERDAARPSDAAFEEVFSGRIDRVAWPEEWGNVTIDCSDAHALVDTWTENAAIYPAGSALEDVMQSILDAEFGAGAYTLSVPSSPGYVTDADFEPESSVWDAIAGLAAKPGWVLWFRYNGEGVSQLTFFEPDRAKTVPDFTHVDARAITQLEVDVNDVRNVVEGYSQDEAGAELTVKLEDAASIAKYGGVRRFMRLVEPEGSVIRTQGQLVAYVAAALSDVKDPDAVMRITVPFFWIGEVSIDLYTFPALEQFYDAAQDLAPYSIEHEFTGGGIQPGSTVLTLRGSPTAGAKTWVRPSRPERAVSLALREKERTDTTVTFAVIAGGALTNLLVWEVQREHPVVAEEGDPETFPWLDPEVASATRVDAMPTEITFTLPPQGQVKFVELIGYAADGRTSAALLFALDPSMAEPDVVHFVRAAVNHTTGAVVIDAWVSDKTLSVRTSTAIGADPGFPAVASIEAGTIRTPSLGRVSWELPSDSVQPGHMIRGGVAPYVTALGTGAAGVTDHGAIVRFESTRNKAHFSMIEAQVPNEANDQVTVYGKLQNKGNHPVNIYARYTVSSGLPEPWSLLATLAANESVHSFTFPLFERHASLPEMEARGTVDGSPFTASLPLPAFDMGQVPNGNAAILNFTDAGDANVGISGGDSDTDGAYFWAWPVADYPGDAAASLILQTKPFAGGRNATSGNVGSRQAAPGEEWIGAALPIGPAPGLYPASSLSLDIKTFAAVKGPAGSINAIVDEYYGTATAATAGNAAVDKWRVAAAFDIAPSEATVRAASFTSGQNLAPGDMGNLLTGLTAPGTVHVAAFPYSAAGREGLIVRDSYVLGVVPPTLSQSLYDEGVGTVEHGVIVHNPSLVSYSLYWRGRLAPDSFGSFTLKAAASTDGTEYSETLGLVEDHGTQFGWLLLCTINGVDYTFPLESPLFDFGLVANMYQLSLAFNSTYQPIATFICDSDTFETEFAGALNGVPGAFVPEATVSGTITFLTTLEPGDTFNVIGRGVDANNGPGPTRDASITRQAEDAAGANVVITDCALSAGITANPGYCRPAYSVEVTKDALDEVDISISWNNPDDDTSSGSDSIVTADTNNSFAGDYTSSVSYAKPSGAGTVSFTMTVTVRRGLGIVAQSTSNAITYNYVVLT